MFRILLYLLTNEPLIVQAYLEQNRLVRLRAQGLPLVEPVLPGHVAEVSRILPLRLLLQLVLDREKPLSFEELNRRGLRSVVQNSQDQIGRDGRVSKAEFVDNLS